MSVLYINFKEKHHANGSSHSSNTRNDTLLHRLVHTQLLSGSLNPELNMTAARRRKALAGRVLELAGDSKLGKGESEVREDEKTRASKRVRDGMMAKRKERDVNLLNEVCVRYSFQTTILSRYCKGKKSGKLSSCPQTTIFCLQ